MTAQRREAAPQQDLAVLRKKIIDLVAQNAIAMVQQAIDAVRDEGQYQAMKYLFEMTGLYPAAAGNDESPEQESLLKILFSELGLSEEDLSERRANRSDRHPVE